jgi:hypothetical protein
MVGGARADVRVLGQDGDDDYGDARPQLGSWQ